MAYKYVTLSHRTLMTTLIMTQVMNLAHNDVSDEPGPPLSVTNFKETPFHYLSSQN
jgi:hypothetical protein